ncbi:hypothetical protein [Aurantimonas sp. HBX-1]|uniref:hypothetical protein n=1 Tax=Aurantimonas sp. HBX-1 TaxID=2906072 RepID=UPI001F42C0E9|nr:hypothetical protein [Aurantimonas sp. HBX-1]UIJ71687.1 hypothetical protein LXB15_18640 [Aurantimonas sp. HBX-1]
MNMMISELYDALMSAGADEAKARRAAEGMATSDQDFRKQFGELCEDNQKMRTEMADLRGELKHEMQALRGEVRGEMAGVRLEMQALRGELSTIKWMGGVLIALVAAMLARALFA